MAELKPCPFCGGRASLVQKGGSFFVKCNRCPGAVVTGCIHQSKEEATKAWNRRAEDGK